jgi:aminoglycoside N3'-acetyltransferase
VDTLRILAIRRGDTVLAHTSFARFEGFTGGVVEAIQTLQAAHKHRMETVRPYRFKGAATLLADFWTEVDKLLKEKVI